MAKLRLLGISCFKVNDITNPDEPYIKLKNANGTTVDPYWSDDNFNRGDGRVISVALHTFDNYVDVYLMEADSPPLNPDDQIGVYRVLSTLAGQGTQVHRYIGDDADYSLFFEVLA